MATAPLFEPEEWAALTGPISEQDPAGTKRREIDKNRSLFYEINDARAIANDEEARARRGAQVNPDIAKNWREIRKLATKFLTGVAKDIGISVILTEALVRSGGFAGLRDGLTLTASLLDQFGDVLKQSLEPDETPASLLGALTNAVGPRSGEAALRPPLLALPLSDSSAADSATWAALVVAKDASRRQAAASGATTKPSRTASDIESDIRNASPAFLDDLRDDLAAASNSVKALQESLNRFAGSPAGAPSCAKILDLVTEIRRAVVALVGERKPPAAPPSQDGTAAAAQEDKTPKPDQRQQTCVAFPSRDAAFAHLGVVADFFRAASPQSLIAPAIDDVIRRGQLSWNELLCEVLPDEAARTSFLRAAGIKWPPAASPAASAPAVAPAPEPPAPPNDSIGVDAACAALVEPFRDDSSGAAALFGRVEEMLTGSDDGAAPESSAGKLLALMSRLRNAVLAQANGDGGQRCPEQPEAIRSTQREEPPAPAPEPPRDRDDAFRQLRHIADYFRETDPQAPIGGAVEDVIRRGRLPFGELVAELLPDDKARAAFLLATGIRWFPAQGAPK